MHHIQHPDNEHVVLRVILFHYNMYKRCLAAAVEGSEG